MKRTVPHRVAMWALLGVAGSVAALIGGAFVLLDRFSPGLAPFAVFGVVFLLLGLLLAWSGRFLYLAAPGALFFTMGAAALGSEYGIAHPESFFDFVPPFVTVVGGLVAVIAAVVAIVRRVRHTEEREPSPGRRRLVLAIPALVVAAIVVSGALTLVQQPTLVTAGDAVEVVTESDRFIPEDFRATSGSRVRFLVRNDDPYAHTFSIDELEIDEYIGPLAERLVTVQLPGTPRSSTYELYCAIAGHEGMVGEIVAEPRRPRTS